MTDKIVVISTCGSSEEAEALSRRLVERKLAACVTVIPQARSFYRWNNEVTDSTEWLLLIKTSRPLLGQLQKEIESGHSYELPELLALPVIDGSPGYLSWMDAELISAEPLSAETA